MSSAGGNGTAEIAKGKPCKIWDCKRMSRKSCVVLDIHSLKTEGKRRLNIPDEQQVRVILEEDGTEVEDNDYFQLIPDFSTFMILKQQESWMPRTTGYDSIAKMYAETIGSYRSPLDDPNSSISSSDAVDGSQSGSSQDRAMQLFGQLCTGNAYKQLLPWLLLRPVDLEELVNADPDQLPTSFPRHVVDAIQEMSHKALTDYNNAQKAVQMLNLYDQAMIHQGHK